MCVSLVTVVGEPGEASIIPKDNILHMVSNSSKQPTVDAGTPRNWRIFMEQKYGTPINLTEENPRTKEATKYLQSSNTITLVSEGSVLGNGKKLHQYMECNRSNRPFNSNGEQTAYGL